MERPHEVQSLRKAIDMLMCFSSAQSELSLADLHRLTGIPKGTIHRIAGELIHRGVLGQNELSRTYYLGSTLRVLGGIVRTDQHLKDAAYQVIRDLGRLVGETVNLSIPSGRLRICIEVVDSAHDIRLSTFVGQSSPLHVGASARSILAFMEPALIEAHLSERLEAVTPATITDPERVRESLAEVRRAGYAISESERVTGAISIGAPVFNAAGQVVASVAVGVPTFRFTPVRLLSLIPAILEAGAAISERLGCQKAEAPGYNKQPP